MNVTFPDFDHCTVAMQENVLVLRKDILKYIGAKGHYTSTYSQMVQNDRANREKCKSLVDPNKG